MHLISSDAIYSAAHLTGKTGIKKILMIKAAASVFHLVLYRVADIKP